MRALTITALLLPLLLSACSTRGTIPQNKHIYQDGPLQVHPGLIGQPSAAAPRPILATPPAPATAQNEALPKLDTVGLRTQRSFYFDLNGTEVKADYSGSLRAHGEYLASHKTARVRVEGHADERGSNELNVRLGRERARQVSAALIAGGASAKQISIASLGKSRPKLAGHDETSWAENRRADVIYEKGE